jgi:NADH-quinone oxidoreductase subunit H
VPFLFVVPLSAIIFFISALAETGRTPFDLLEAESEIVAGFHVEYSGMKFGMFFLAEFMSALFMSGLFAVIYLGGYRFFGLEELVTSGGFAIGRLIGLVVFFVKMFAMYFVFIWIRSTLPRIRIDQLLNLNWKFWVPLSLVLIFTVAIVDKLIPASAGVYGRYAIHLLANLIIGFGALEILRRRARQARQAQEGEGGETAVSATTATADVAASASH